MRLQLPGVLQGEGSVRDEVRGAAGPEEVIWEAREGALAQA